MPESLFNKIAALKPATSWKSRLRHRFFPRQFCEIFGTPMDVVSHHGARVFCRMTLMEFPQIFARKHPRWSPSSVKFLGLSGCEAATSLKRITPKMFSGVICQIFENRFFEFSFDTNDNCFWLRWMKKLSIYNLKNLSIYNFWIQFYQRWLHHWHFENNFLKNIFKLQFTGECMRGCLFQTE